MERAILVIVLIVGMVGIVGLFSRYDIGSSADALGSGITGNVVAGSGADCSSCSGYIPVCGKMNHRLITYPNPCSAVCTGAELMTDEPCDAIPRV